MAGGLFNRLHVWTFGEVLKSSDLNAEFDNIINNLQPLKLSGFSTTIPQSQIQKDPGSLGSQNLAANLAEEIEELRFVISRVIGLPYWFSSPALSIATINSLLKLGVGVPSNRIISGRTRGTSNQPLFLMADGTTPKVTLKAGGGNPIFTFVVNNSTYTASADIVVSGLSVAPNTNNTATVNDANIVNDPFAGERDADIDHITISGVGTEITSRIGQYAAFKFTDGGNTEYFIGYIADATTIKECFRGYFFDSADTPIPRVNLNNADTLSLMRMTWVFAQTTGTSLDFAYTNPKVSIATPGSPAVGDYWFDMTAQIWKKFNGVAFVDATAVLIGICIQDTTKTVASRSFEFFALYSSLNEIGIRKDSNTQAISETSAPKVSVAGTILDFQTDFIRWNTATNMDTGVVLSNTTRYFLYLTDLGKPVISDVAPYDRNADLYGKYHPFNPWRCVGETITDGAAHLIVAGDFLIRPIFCSLARAATQTVPDNNETVVQLDTIIEDNFGLARNLSSSTARIVIPRSDIYDINYQAQFDTGGVDRYAVAIRQNAADSDSVSLTVNVPARFGKSEMLRLKCGDTIDLVTQNLVNAAHDISACKLTIKSSARL